MWSMFCFVALLHAQAPTGYYNRASGAKGAALKTALHGIIADHTVRTYDNLWSDFRKTDMREDGRVWDMYSSKTNYTFGTDQAGTYKTEGDCYNREHSFPKSWFNDAKPMYTDLFHLYPTDGYVNGRRSNYPYGEVKNVTWSSSGDFSKVGASGVSGYSGTVFEPNDEYKGDLARTYFYMATRYEDRIAGWSSPMLSGNSYPAYAEWAVTMLLRWAAEDPVSQKEIDRNNAVYGIQKNRNPFIDFPGLEQYVWGNMKEVAFNPDNYEQGGTPDGPDVNVAAPVFSPTGGEVERGSEVTITCETEGAYIYYTVNDGDLQIAYPPVRLTVESSISVTAYAMLGNHRSEEVTASFTVPGSAMIGENVFVRLEDTADLKAGMHCLIVCEAKEVALSEQKNDIRSYAAATPTDGELTTEVNGNNLPYALVLGGSEDAWTLYDGVGNYYLALNSSDNKLHTSATATDKKAQWTISISADGTADIYNASYTNRCIRYNASSPRFACYKGTMQPVALYANKVTTGIKEAMSHNGLVTVYDINGRIVRHNVSADEAFRGLPRGLYVVGRTKVFVR